MIPRRTFTVLTLCAALGTAVLWGQSSGTGAPAEAGEAVHDGAAAQGADAPAAAPDETPTDPKVLADIWGVKVEAVRLTAADMMLDVRLRVLDPVKADLLFSHSNLPVLFNPATGHKLQVPNTPTTGRLRPTAAPEKGRVYPMLFGNAFRELQRGGKVTLRIGKFEAVGLVIE